MTVDSFRLFSRALKLNIFLVLFVAIVSTFLIFYNVTTIYVTSNQPTTEHSKYQNKNTRKVILYWNTFYGDTDMNLGLGEDIFENCSISTCYATNIRTFLPEDSFDAIIFHASKWNHKRDGVPQWRSRKQKYIFYSWDSPYNVDFDEIYYRENKGFYNWSMTYRLDSDIPFPYGIVQKKKTNYVMPTITEIVHRPKMIAWIENKCDSESAERASKLVSRLEEYFPIDIYGDCGTLQCQNCFEMIERTYLFYLSFEETMCDDYVTNRLYTPLKYNIVPIVLGKGDYKRLAPPHSVVNIADFKEFIDLVNYLIKLSNNPDLYLKYFEWKENYVIEDPRQNVLCKLCDMIHKKIEYTWYEDIKSWYFGVEKCYV